MSLDLIQGSPEWLQARCGSLGASQVAMALAKTKTGWGASRANLQAQLVAERLTKTPQESYQSAEMRYGSECEPEARAAYEAQTGYLVETVGIVKHPRFAFAHASPDGLVNSDGLVELKCPNSATHIDTLLSGEFDNKYHTQCYWQMACTGRQWVDLTSYDRRMPDHMRLFIKRIPRNEERIAEIEKEVERFLHDVATCYMALTTKFPDAAAA